ncbi:MAG TPA: sigma-E factor negative regulatory protein [Ramlibacter sp.]
MDKREMISALADGQLAGEAFARGMELAATDAAGREAWHAYHLIGDVLRSSDLAAGAPPAQFIARLQSRLRDERILVDAAVAAAAMPVREAANDFRWKLVAGVASVAAVSAIAWSLVGGVPASQEGPQLAASTVPAGTVLASTKQGVMIRDPRLDELLAAHRQLGGATLVAPAGYLRNATFDGPGR